MAISTAVLFVLAFCTLSHAQLLKFGDTCFPADSSNACNPSSGLVCLGNLCRCVLPEMVYYPDREVCVAPAATACFLDGTAPCGDNSVCTENAFDGSAQCVCISGFRPVAAQSCDTPDVNINPVDGNQFPAICCSISYVG